jgi:hypothetical protein
VCFTPGLRGREAPGARASSTLSITDPASYGNGGSLTRLTGPPIVRPMNARPELRDASTDNPLRSRSALSDNLALNTLDAYWPSTWIPMYPPSQIPVLPWFDPSNPKTPQPTKYTIKQQFCWYAGWGMLYLSVVLRVLTSTGGALAFPEATAALFVTVLIINAARHVICA